ncbi:hypothetical protein M8494_22735 [Serratia ureilytica]
MSSDELLCTRKNWNRVIPEGRKPGQTIGIGCGASHEPLEKSGQGVVRRSASSGGSVGRRSRRSPIPAGVR